MARRGREKIRSSRCWRVSSRVNGCRSGWGTPVAAPLAGRLGPPARLGRSDHRRIASREAGAGSNILYDSSNVANLIQEVRQPDSDVPREGSGVLSDSWRGERIRRSLIGARETVTFMLRPGPKCKSNFSASPSFAKKNLTTRLGIDSIARPRTLISSSPIGPRDIVRARLFRARLVVSSGSLLLRGLSSINRSE